MYLFFPELVTGETTSMTTEIYAYLTYALDSIRCALADITVVTAYTHTHTQAQLPRPDRILIAV